MLDTKYDIKYYEEIFRVNGASYHKAMQLCPHARDVEFETALSFLNLKAGDSLLDVPAGGGYLKSYLPDGMHYYGFDFSGGFTHQSEDVDKCTETEIPLANNSVDHIVCLAAMHHVENRVGFYQECRRILKPGGMLLIGDVMSGSTQDTFLNQFVNQWNRLGHCGDFLRPEREQQDLNITGFDSRLEERSYSWSFKSLQEATHYFKLLFTMNLNPSEALIAEQIEILGAKKDASSRLNVNWHLGFVIATA